MSTHSNPFIQGGWYGPSPNTIGSDSSSSPQSMYGVLPYGAPSSSAGWVVYQFTNLNPTILNSIIIGPDRQPFMKLTTDLNLSGYTTFKDVENRGVALVEWNPLPKAEIRGSLRKIAAAEWLSVSMNARFGRHVRQMEVNGARFVWCPNGEFIHLFTQSPESSPCVTVVKRRNGVDLMFTPQAVSWGLVEPCIVAVTLLLSGRRLE